VNASEPRGYRGSTTTGTFGESSDFVRRIARDVQENTPKHRTIVLAQNEFRFANYCLTCSWLLTPRGASKDELQALAKEHEESNAA
jgi:hypothetical protein